MLTKLDIINGVMTPKYDIYNDSYTVSIADDVTRLDINYEFENSNESIKIIGNENLVNEQNLVSIIINGEDINRTINLNVIKDRVESTASLKEYFASLEIKKKEEVSDYVAPLIGSICFLLIVIAFSILFHKKKKLK